MPDQPLWDSFFNIDLILSSLEINSEIHNILEIGCGYGTFTIPVSKKISGLIYAFDIDLKMIDHVKLQIKDIENIKLYNRDIIKDKSGLKEKSVDYVLLFNILHNKNPEDLLNEAYRVLKPNGKIGIIHWRSDIKTPRGPNLLIRPTPKQIINYLDKSKWKLEKDAFNIEPYHFGILIRKK